MLVRKRLGHHIGSAQFGYEKFKLNKVSKLGGTNLNNLFWDILKKNS